MKETKDQTKEERISDKRVRRLQMIGLRILVLLVAIWIVFFWIIGITTVPNGYMFPSLKAGDLLIYYKMDTELVSGDVITFHKNDTKYVGRIVAVGGDTVDITDEEKLSINGNAVYETGIFYNTPKYEGFSDYPLVVDEDSFFVLVDMREGGEDSRYFGPVSRDEIDGLIIEVLRRNDI